MTWTNSRESQPQGSRTRKCHSKVQVRHNWKRRTTLHECISLSSLFTQTALARPPKTLPDCFVDCVAKRQHIMHWTTQTCYTSGRESALCLLLTLCVHFGCQRMTTSVKKTTVECWLLQGILVAAACPSGVFDSQSRQVCNGAENRLKRNLRIDVNYASSVLYLWSLNLTFSKTFNQSKGLECYFN